ncbi:MAG: CPBP family intramembrane metalloprotease [Anaerolineae bacterium]|nr:CPBP family intramembrane metalloprotease [Anaerolineae bacterium]
MNEFPITHWLILLIASLFGVLTVIPYQFSLISDKLKTAREKMPLSVLLLLTLIQNGIMIGVAAALGLLAARAVGLQTPLLDALLGIESRTVVPLTLILAAIVGAGAGLAIIVLDRVVFHRHMPAALIEMSQGHLAAWKRFLVGFYGGITEEVLLRLFVMSGALWLLRQIGLDMTVSAWTAILFASLLFGAGHLPAVASLTRLTPVVVARTLVLNGVGGIAFGWLYWRYGLEWAMIAHFAADMIIQFGAPVVNSTFRVPAPAQSVQQIA